MVEGQRLSSSSPTATTERKTYGVHNPMRKRKGKKVERITGTRIYFIVICQVTLFRSI